VSVRGDKRFAQGCGEVLVERSVLEALIKLGGARLQVGIEEVHRCLANGVAFEPMAVEHRE
jgi:hypothetical protein